MRLDARRRHEFAQSPALYTRVPPSHLPAPDHSPAIPHPTALAAAELTALALRLAGEGMPLVDVVDALHRRCQTRRRTYREDVLGNLATWWSLGDPADWMAHGWDDCTTAIGLPGGDEGRLLQVEPVIHHVDERQPVSSHTVDHGTSSNRHRTARTDHLPADGSHSFALVGRSGWAAPLDAASLPPTVAHRLGPVVLRVTGPSRGRCGTRPPFRVPGQDVRPPRRGPASRGPCRSRC
ncbi:hypothetical protein [Micromonospora sp. CA-111912]|uniref:hypothetical protein n=1 Tax=Micromonospora sp. CA-111912 TaxID=3239955 RepID=UPI003D8A96B7